MTSLFLCMVVGVVVLRLWGALIVWRLRFDGMLGIV